MARTNKGAVQELLLSDYDGDSSLEPFVRQANLITTRVATCATGKGTSLTFEELVEIEGLLACWLYTGSERIYTSRSTGRASGSFHVPENPYLERAKALDPSGCVAAITSGNTAWGFWAGKAPSEQTPYHQRD